MSSATALTWMEDHRSRRCAELLIIIWIISLADLVFTIWAHAFTPFRELNPIAGAMLQNNLVPSLVIYKLLVNVIGSLIFWRLRDHTRAEAGLWFVMITYVALAFRWSSYTLAASTQIQM